MEVPDLTNDVGEEERNHWSNPREEHIDQACIDRWNTCGSLTGWRGLTPDWLAEIPGSAAASRSLTEEHHVPGRTDTPTA